VQLHFHFRFLLTGVRLRAVAPDAALLLDTGFFTLEVVGRPAGASVSGDPAHARENKALQWKIGLQGLSIAATSCHQRAGWPGHPIAKEAADGTGTGKATGPKTWVLAHVRTNLEMQNRAEELTLDDRNPSTRPLPRARQPTNSARAPATGHNFSLNLSHTEALAHPVWLPPPAPPSHLPFPPTQTLHSPFTHTPRTLHLPSARQPPLTPHPNGMRVCTLRVCSVLVVCACASVCALCVCPVRVLSLCSPSLCVLCSVRVLCVSVCSVTPRHSNERSGARKGMHIALKRAMP
jgi:hypothetical protein